MYTPTLRNQFIARQLCCDAIRLEQYLGFNPPLGTFTMAAWLCVSEPALIDLLANAPTSEALAAIPPLVSANA